MVVSTNLVDIVVTEVVAAVYTRGTKGTLIVGRPCHWKGSLGPVVTLKKGILGLLYIWGQEGLFIVVPPIIGKFLHFI